MTHDFAKRSTTRQASTNKNTVKRSRSTPSRTPQTTKQSAPNKSRLTVILSLLVLLAAFGGGLYLLQSVPPAPTPAEIAKQTKVAPPKSESKAKPNQTKPKEKVDPRFKFYEIFEETEVSTTQIDAYKFKEKTKEKSYYYMVQTGSFRSSEDAERQKATIAFRGLKATIEPFQNTQGQTWHRVSTGPFYDRSQMNAAVDKLVALSIQPLVKKIEVADKR